MSTRHRLPLAPTQPAQNVRTSRATGSSPALVSERIVLAVTGEDALVRAFVAVLVARAEGSCAVFVADQRVGDEDGLTATQAWLDQQPRDAWVLAVGEDARARLQPTFLVGLGRRHETSAATTDLWLGQSSEVVAGALVHALRSRTKS